MPEKDRGPPVIGTSVVTGISRTRYKLKLPLGLKLQISSSEIILEDLPLIGYCQKATKVGDKFLFSLISYPLRLTTSIYTLHVIEKVKKKKTTKRKRIEIDEKDQKIQNVYS